VASGALHLHPLVNVEINFLVMCAGGDGAARRRVPHHEIRIGPQSNRPLARENVEDLRRRRGGDPHEIRRCETPTPDAMMPQHAHPILDPAGAIWDQREVISAGGFLRCAEAAMVRRRGLQAAGG
jgi:hypothetical protein